MGKSAITSSRILGSRELNSQTRLKFRAPGQTSADDVARRDLKLELLAAERVASERKAKGLSGYIAGPDDQGPVAGLIEAAPTLLTDREAADIKRKKALAQLGTLDADDEEQITGGDAGHGKGKGRATSEEVAQQDREQGQDEDDEEEESSDDDDEDETAELLRELEKIKRERAEEKAKAEMEKAASDYISREEEIATGNPLLNLQSALNIPASPAPSMTSSMGSSSFGVKRRWDDDVIFKNQARGTSQTPRKEFVNDLLRTEFHKRFMKYVPVHRA